MNEIFILQCLKFKKNYNNFCFFLTKVMESLKKLIIVIFICSSNNISGKIRVNTYLLFKLLFKLLMNDI